MCLQDRLTAVDAPLFICWIELHLRLYNFGDNPLFSERRKNLWRPFLAAIQLIRDAL